MLVCTGCAKAVLITIRMRVAGREIVFHRCSKCEANTWQDDMGVLSVNEVLELAPPVWGVGERRRGDALFGTRPRDGVSVSRRGNLASLPPVAASTTQSGAVT